MKLRLISTGAMFLILAEMGFASYGMAGLAGVVGISGVVLLVVWIARTS